MYKAPIKYLLLLALVLFFVQCKKKCEDKEYFLDTEIRHANQFKFGSHWIYQDSLTGLLDSVTSGETEISMPDMSNPSGSLEGGNRCSELVEVSQLFYGFRSQNTLGVYEVLPRTNPNGPGYAYVQADRSGGGRENLSGIFFDCFTSFTKKGELVGVVDNSKGKGWDKFLAFYPSYNVNGISYSNVYHIESKKVETYEGTDTTYVNIMYSTHSGVIKMRYQKFGGTLKVKELIRSNIVK